MLDAQVREQAIDILWSDSLRRKVVHFLDFASFERLSLLRDLLLDNLVDLSLQLIFLIDHFLVCLGVALLHGGFSGR